MKHKKFIFCGSILVTSIIASLSFSLSWFDTRTNLQPSEIYGSSENAYFAYGKGTKDQPYGITNPRHLYNLAWLQYMGKFNGTDSNGNVVQVYFELGSDIDMSSLKTALPPIGTVANPFVGSFNGNSHTISNLSISSSSDDLKKKPYIVGNNYNEPNIIGMFGVVGDIEGDSTSLSYDSSVLSITDFKLENPTITTDKENALTGIVAGYVNGSISNVTLLEPKLDFTTNTSSLQSTYSNFKNVSNYSVAGYCESEYEETIKSTVTTLSNKTSDAVQFTKQEAGNGQGWGGSIDMKEMYTNLKTNWDTFVDSPSTLATKYATASTVIRHSDGTEEETVASTSPVKVLSTSIDGSTNAKNYIYSTYSYGNYISFYETESKDSDDVTSSYSYVIENPDTAKSSSSESKYMCLTGYANRTITNGKTSTVTEYKNKQLFYSTVDETKHYLGYDSVTGSIVDTLDKDSALEIYLDDNYLLNVSIPNDSNSTTYYLQRDDTSLSLTTSSNEATAWQYNEDFKAYYDEYGYALCFKNNSWICELVEYYYTISSGNYYLNLNGSTIVASSTSTTKWYVDDNSYIYTLNDNDEKNYLGFSQTQTSGWRRTYTYTLSASTNPNIKFTLNSNTIVGTATESSFWSSSSVNIYLYLNGTTWGCQKGTNGSTLNQVFLNNYVFSTENGKDEYVYKNSFTETLNSTFTTQDTYFPLNHSDGVPDQKNTGYVVSGSNYNNDAYGDIRVSAYPISSSLTNYSNNTFSKIYTINDSGTAVDITNSTSYKKFDKAKTSLLQVLSGQTYVYGLHFMNANIGLKYSDGHKVRVPKAIINGTEYTNYQVPYDCIDFNLKDKGYINFFAGSYYPQNNSFFSLYQIHRDPGNVSNIKSLERIIKIYAPKNSKDDYVYEYEDEDGETSSSASTSGLSVIFDVESWIEKPSSLTNNEAYYFEIPVNSGEYALGSVNGKLGAYLMYLDIGANAQVVNRTTVTELVKQTRSTYKYAKGISIIDAGTTDTADSNSYCVLIEDITSSSGSSVTFNRDSTSSSANVTYTNTAKISCDYKKEALDLKINNATASITPLSESTKTTKRLTYYDYSINDGTIEVYQLTKETDFDSTTENSIGRYYVIDSDGNAGDDQTDYSVYNDSGTIVDTPTSIEIDTDINMKQIYQFLVESPNGSTETYTIEFENVGSLSSTIDDNGYYPYVINGYKFTIKDSSGTDVTCNVTVKQVGDSTYTFTFNTDTTNRNSAVIFEITF